MTHPTINNLKHNYSLAAQMLDGISPEFKSRNNRTEASYLSSTDHNQSMNNTYAVLQNVRSLLEASDSCLDQFTIRLCNSIIDVRLSGDIQGVRAMRAFTRVRLNQVTHAYRLKSAHETITLKSPDETLMPPNWKPGPKDIVCILGSQINVQEGNRDFNKLIKAYCLAHADTTCNQKKSKITNHIYRVLTNKGRFVRKESGRWVDIGYKKGRLRISGAMRKEVRKLSKSNKIDISKAKSSDRKSAPKPQLNPMRTTEHNQFKSIFETTTQESTKNILNHTIENINTSVSLSQSIGSFSDMTMVDTEGTESTIPKEIQFPSSVDNNISETMKTLDDTWMTDSICSFDNSFCEESESSEQDDALSTFKSRDTIGSWDSFSQMENDNESLTNIFD